MDSLRTRTAATNLGGARGYRILEGKLAIITGASRGLSPQPCSPSPLTVHRYWSQHSSQFGSQRSNPSPKLHIRLLRPGMQRAFLPAHRRTRHHLPRNSSGHGNPQWTSPYRQHCQKPLLPPQDRKVPNRHHHKQRRSVQES